MKEINYLEIFKRAFAITWKNKFLWFFGFFLLASSFSINYNVDTSKLTQIMPQVQIPGWFYNTTLLIVLATLIIAVFILLYVMKILSLAAIIKSSNNIAVYSSSGMSAIIKEVRSSFWTLLAIEIILDIFLVAIFLVMLAPIAALFFLKSWIMATTAAILGIGIFVPLAALVFFLKKYGFIFAVLGKNKMRLSLEMAYNLFKGKTRESLLMGLFSILTSLAYCLGLIFSLTSAIIIFALVCVATFYLSKTLAIAAGIIFVILAVILLIVAASFLQAFLQVAWVLFFQQIAFIKDKESAVKEEVVVLENIPDPGVI